MQKIALLEFKQFEAALGSGSGKIVQAIDTAVNQSKLVLNPSNVPPPSTPEVLKITSQSDLNTARGNLQNIFNKPGISIAISAEDHRYQQEAPPTGDPLETLKNKRVPNTLLNDPATQLYITQHPEISLSKRFAEALLDPMAVMSKTQGWFAEYLDEQVSNMAGIKIDENRRVQVASAQEWYAKSKSDQERGAQLKLLAQGGAQFPKADLVLLEKKLRNFYPNNAEDVHEESLFPNLESLSARKRSRIIAAYLFLCFAGGDQSKQDRVLILIGENHVDIFEHLERFIQESTAITWVKNRPRTYLTIPSHVISKTII